MTTVTEQVSMWVNNDQGPYSVGKAYALKGDLDSLKEYCLDIIKSADSNSGPGWIGYHFSGHDLDNNVDWAEVARDLVGDDIDDLEPEVKEALGLD